MAWNQPKNKATPGQEEKVIAVGAPVAYNAGMVGRPYSDGWDIERAYREGVAKVTWVWRSIDAIAGNQARLPMIMRENNSPTGELVENSDLAPLLNSVANDGESAFAFRYRLSSQLLMSSRGVFVEIVRGRGGQPVALHLLPPQNTAPIPDPKKFVSGFEVALPDGSKKVLKPDNVLWVRRPHPLDPYLSMTPMEAAGIAIEVESLAKVYNRNFLLNDGRPGGLLVIRGEIDEDDKEELRSRFRGNLAQSGAVGVISSDEGADFVDTGASPRDAAYIQMRDLTKNEILAAFGVPESIIGNASGRTFSNAAEEGKVFWMETMMPHLELLSRAFDVLDDKNYVTFETESVPILIMAKQERNQFLLNEYQNGLISANEYRGGTGKIEVVSELADSLLSNPNLTPIGNTEMPLDEMQQGQQGGAEPGGPEGMPPEGEGPPPEGEPPGEGQQVPEGPPPEAGAPPPQEQAPQAAGIPPVGPPGDFGLLGEMPEGLEVKRFDLGDEWQSKALEDVDRWESLFGRSLERFFERQQRVVLEKASSVKTRRALENGTLTVEQVFDREVWDRQVREDLQPLILGAFGQAVEGSTTESDEKVETTEEEVQEYAEEQLQRVEQVNETTKKELAAAILLALLLKDDDDDDANILLKVSLLKTAITAVFVYTLTKRLKGIAEVESQSAYNAGVYFSGQRAGATTKTWLTRKDERVRSAHRTLEGKTIPIGEGFKAGGAILRFPGDPLAPPGLTINCRCLLRFGK